jgi:hypothetical protein
VQLLIPAEQRDKKGAGTAAEVEDDAISGEIVSLR